MHTPHSSVSLDTHRNRLPSSTSLKAIFFALEIEQRTHQGRDHYRYRASNHAFRLPLPARRDLRSSAAPNSFVCGIKRQRAPLATTSPRIYSIKRTAAGRTSRWSRVTDAEALDAAPGTSLGLVFKHRGPRLVKGAPAPPTHPETAYTRGLASQSLPVKYASSSSALNSSVILRSTSLSFVSSLRSRHNPNYPSQAQKQQQQQFLLQSQLRHPQYSHESPNLTKQEFRFRNRYKIHTRLLAILFTITHLQRRLSQLVLSNIIPYIPNDPDGRKFKKRIENLRSRQSDIAFRLLNYDAHINSDVGRLDKWLILDEKRVLERIMVSTFSRTPGFRSTKLVQPPPPLVSHTSPPAGKPDEDSDLKLIEFLENYYDGYCTDNLLTIDITLRLILGIPTLIPGSKFCELCNLTTRLIANVRPVFLEYVKQTYNVEVKPIDDVL